MYLIKHEARYIGGCREDSDAFSFDENVYLVETENEAVMKAFEMMHRFINDNWKSCHASIDYNDPIEYYDEYDITIFKLAPGEWTDIEKTLYLKGYAKPDNTGLLHVRLYGSDPFKKLKFEYPK